MMFLKKTKSLAAQEVQAADYIKMLTISGS